MVGFLMHMYGNLKVFLGADVYNHYVEWLKQDMLYPSMPHGWFICLLAVMLLAIVLHMYSAWTLTQRAHNARSVKYVSVKRPRRPTQPARCGGRRDLAGFLGVPHPPVHGSGRDDRLKAGGDAQDGRGVVS